MEAAAEEKLAISYQLSAVSKTWKILDSEFGLAESRKLTPESYSSYFFAKCRNER
jgi:hypothetical protein